jgi:hypothetical protein
MKEGAMRPCTRRLRRPLVFAAISFVSSLSHSRSLAFSLSRRPLSCRALSDAYRLASWHAGGFIQLCHLAVLAPAKIIITSVNVAHNAPVELSLPGPSYCPLRFFNSSIFLSFAFSSPIF